MIRSNDLSRIPHMTENTEPPEPGHLVLGPDGLFAVCYVGPNSCTGLLEGDIVDLDFDHYRENFPHRILLKESMNERNPETRSN